MLSTNHFRASVGAALAIGAIAAPAASASPIHDGMSARQAQAATSASAARKIDPRAFSRQDKQVVPAAQVGASNATGGSVASSPVAATDAGFNWGDAGIGAAGGLVLVIGGLGGALAVTRRRSDGTGRTAQVTG